jgi:hypothetical protein
VIGALKELVRSSIALPQTDRERAVELVKGFIQEGEGGSFQFTSLSHLPRENGGMLVWAIIDFMDGTRWAVVMDESGIHESMVLDVVDPYETCTQINQLTALAQSWI